MSLGSQYGELKEFYKLFIDIKNYKPPSLLKQKIVTIELWKMSINFTINISTLTKNYDSEDVKDEERRGRDYKQFEITDEKKQ